MISNAKGAEPTTKGAEPTTKGAEPTTKGAELVEAPALRQAQGALLALLPPGSRPKLTVHLVLTVLSVCLRALGAVLLVPLVTALLSGQPSDAWPWVAGLAATTVAGWAVDQRIARIGFDLGFGLLDHAQHRIADRLTRVRLTWFTATNTATARQAIAATGPDLVGMIVYLLTPLLAAVLLPIAIAVALLPISWPLALAALAGCPLLLGAFWATGRLGRAADRAAERANTALTERIIEFARTQQALRAARRVHPAESHAGAALAAQHGATVRLLLMQIPGQLLFSLASQLALIALTATTVTLTVRGELAVPAAIGLIVVIIRYLEPFTALAELAPGIENATATLRRLKEVLDAPAELAGETGAGLSHPPRISLTKVGFGYGDQAVLSDFDLELEPGTRTAIVGPSGSGKSTVLGLLAGLYQPGSGRILIDGLDASSLSADARRDLVSVVFQEPYLFDGPLEDNILVGRPGADPEEIARAARLAEVDEIVGRLPDGWATRVGEGGTNLSGGERQRVSIARALIKPAPVLLIDEATSALDTENEAAVVAALTSDPTPRTRVIVAHRLASIRTADRVIFLDDGRIVEDGAPDDLLAAGGRFAAFWREQDDSTRWRISARIRSR